MYGTLGSLQLLNNFNKRLNNYTRLVVVSQIEFVFYNCLVLYKMSCQNLLIQLPLTNFAVQPADFGSAPA